MSTVNFYAGFILGECIDYAIGRKTRALTSSWAQFRTWGWISRFRKEIRFGWSLRHTTELKLRTHARPRLGREPVRTTEPWPGKSRVEAIRIRLMKHGWTGLGLQACGQQNYSNLCVYLNLQVQLLVCQFPAPLTCNNQFLLDWSLLVDWVTDLDRKFVSVVKPTEFCWYIYQSMQW